MPTLTAVPDAVADAVALMAEREAHLAPPVAQRSLGALGRLLFAADPVTMWEHDTRTLPGVLQRMRRRYRAFAQEQIAPRGLAADGDPGCADIPGLFLTAARHGLQTEFLPWPMGTMNLRAAYHSLLLPAALKAEELCAADAGLGLGLLAHELGIGPLFISGDLRAVMGWQAKIYREIRRGEPAITAFAITEPAAGSDVEETAGAARARLGCFYEQVPGGFRLSGRKCFISNGAVARWVTLFAAEKSRGIETWTCFLLDRDMEGLSVGRHERKMGQRAADASDLVLDDLFVPSQRVVGGVGGGWAISRNVLNYSRPIIGAIALGIARGAFEHTVKFCAETHLGGRRLLEHQHVQLTLADMLMRLTAMRATVWQAARHRVPFQAAGAMAKVFCSDNAWQICNDAMTLMGDHGYLHGHSVEKAARDARLTQIYEGTNDINRLAIFENQVGADFPVVVRP